MTAHVYIVYKRVGVLNPYLIDSVCSTKEKADKVADSLRVGVYRGTLVQKVTLNRKGSAKLRK